MSWYSPPVGFATSAATPPPVFAEERLMRVWEATGFFWIPGGITNECWGTISFKPGDGMKITLEGNLFGNSRPRPIEIPIIHGRLYNGALCSIFNCWCAVETFTTTQQYYRTQVTSKLSALGGHWESPDECKLESVHIKFSHLNQWFDVPYELEYEGKEYEKFSMSFSEEKFQSKLHFEDVAVVLSSVCARTLPMAAAPTGTSWTYSYQICLTPSEPQGLTWFIDLIAAVRDMFAFLIGCGIYTLDVRALTQEAGIDTSVLLQFPVSIPRAVRLDNTYFSTRLMDSRTTVPLLRGLSAEMN